MKKLKYQTVARELNTNKGEVIKILETTIEVFAYNWPKKG